MATNVWIGGANGGNSVPKLETFTPASVSTGGVYTLTMAGTTVSYTAISTDTVATVCAALLVALKGTTANPVPIYFTKLTWTGVGTAGSFTAIQAMGESDGRPFTVTSSATGGSATFAGSVTRSALSTSDVGLAANWSLGVPVNGQDILIAGTNLPGLLYNLTALASVAPNSVTVTANVQIGLPQFRQAGYLEYLPQYFQLTSVTTNLTVDNNASIMKFDFQAGTVIANVLATGRASNLVPNALCFINGPTTLNVYGGDVGVAMLPGEAATISGNASLEGNGNLDLGPGVTMTGTVTAFSRSTLTTACNLGTVTINQAQWTTTGVGTCVNATLVNGGSVTYDSTGAITGTLIIGSNCTADFSGNPQGCTVANCTMYANSTLTDPQRVVVLSNQILLSQCGLEDVRITRSKNYHVTV